MARLACRGHLHPRRGDPAAGLGLAAAAGDPDDPALRGGHPRRARGGAETGVAGRAGRRPLAGMTGAGFWRRYAAWSLDAALLAVPSVLLCWPLLRRAAAALARD